MKMKAKYLNAPALLLCATALTLFSCSSTSSTSSISGSDSIISSSSSTSISQGGMGNVNSDTNSTEDIPEQADLTAQKSQIVTNTASTNSEDELTDTLPSTYITVSLVQGGTTAVTGFSVSDNVITIEKAGNYVLEGTLTDGYVQVKKNINAHLFLNGVSIASSTGSPLIYKKDTSSGAPSVLTIVKDTTNTLTDANLEAYTSGDYDDTDLEFKNNSTLFAKRDLTINGKGTLNIKSYYHQGIHSKNNLKVLDGTIVVNSYDHGIKGDTNIFLLGGDISVTSAEGDGVKTDEPDETDAYDGTLYNGLFSPSKLTVDAKYDGIQVYNSALFNSGTYNISTYGGVANRKDYLNNPEKDDSGNIVYDDDGEISYPSADAIKTGMDWTSSLADGASSIYFKGGTYTIDSVDDAINSNNAVLVDDGDFNIKAGDDGMHGDAYYLINDGTINISACYEGLEAANMTFNGGEVTLVAEDDGINASNKHGTVADGQYDSACQMYFNGGTINVSADGDGIDSNGCAEFNGGTVYVNGPTNSGNSSIDTNGGYLIDGGTVLALGSKGMLETPKVSGTQNSATLSATLVKGTNVQIKDDDGNALIEYTCTKTGESIIFSSSVLILNKTYHLYINGTETSSWTQSSVSYSNITTSNGPGEGQPGGIGGGGRH